MSSSFNKDVWKKRAQERHEKSKKKSPANLKRELAYVDHLSTAIEWCDSKNIEVSFGKQYGSTYFTDTQKISINARLLPERQFYMLLHEAGHHLIGERDRHERYGMGYSAEDAGTKRSLVHRVDILDEEIEAWFRGRKLAERLGIDLDKDAFDDLRAKAIKTYVQWVLRSGPPTPEDS